MKAKHLFLAIAVLLAAGGLWLARTAWRPHALQESSMGVGSKMPHARNLDADSAASSSRASQKGPPPGPNDRPESGQMLDSPARPAPPDPSRRFMDFTPEQRVQFARQGHGPGG